MESQPSEDVAEAHGEDVTEAHGGDVTEAHGEEVTEAHGGDVSKAHGKRKQREIAKKICRRRRRSFWRVISSGRITRRR